MARRCFASFLKKELGLLDLGSRQLLATSPEELKLIVDTANKGKIQDAGGQAAWDMLSEDEQEQLNLQTLEDLKTAFGQEVYDKMSDEERRAFDMMLWAGCCMHKELNAAKGGSEGMKNWWKKHPEIPGTIPVPRAFTRVDHAPTRTNPIG
jgi:outer membrane PBP1 activator LpoA protein